MAGFGGKLQAATGGQVDIIDLGHNGGEAGSAQGFLEGPQAILLAPGPGDGQAVMIETEGGEARRIKLLFRGNPEHRTVAANLGEEGGEETGDRRGMPDQFVQAAGRQAAPGQGRVDGRFAEGEGLPGQHAAAGSQSTDPAAQIGDQAAVRQSVRGLLLRMGVRVHQCLQ